ncbi:MAG: hypothetical protein ACI8ZZ_002447, partial [Gammaproteobacteria bacterium]
MDCFLPRHEADFVTQLLEREACCLEQKHQVLAN